MTRTARLERFALSGWTSHFHFHVHFRFRFQRHCHSHSCSQRRHPAVGTTPLCVVCCVFRAICVWESLCTLDFASLAFRSVSVRRPSWLPCCLAHPKGPDTQEGERGKEGREESKRRKVEESKSRKVGEAKRVCAKTTVTEETGIVAWKLCEGTEGEGEREGGETRKGANVDYTTGDIKQQKYMPANTRIQEGKTRSKVNKKEGRAAALPKIRNENDKRQETR